MSDENQRDEQAGPSRLKPDDELQLARLLQDRLNCSEPASREQDQVDDENINIADEAPAAKKVDDTLVPSRPSSKKIEVELNLIGQILRGSKDNWVYLKRIRSARQKREERRRQTTKEMLERLNAEHRARISNAMGGTDRDRADGRHGPACLYYQFKLLHNSNEEIARRGIRQGLPVAHVSDMSVVPHAVHNRWANLLQLPHVVPPATTNNAQGTDWNINDFNDNGNERRPEMPPPDDNNPRMD